MYDNKHYDLLALIDDPEEYSWAVINKDHGTLEHKCHTLPAAIMVSDSLSAELDKLLTDRRRSSIHPVQEVHETSH